MKPFVLFVLFAVIPGPLTDTAERESVLELAHGATVISRTGELLLQNSALQAIDGDPASFWVNPPGDLPQSMTIELAAPARIDKLGLRTVANGAFTANHVTFAASSDGRTFTPVLTAKAKDSNDAQWFDVKPFGATQIRVSMNDSLLPGHDVRLNSILARGVAVAQSVKRGVGSKLRSTRPD